jgi:hypothetical protein
MGNQQFDRQTIINAVANKSIVWITGQDLTTIPAMTLQRVSIYSPAGTISRLFNVRLTYDTDNNSGLTGTKEFIVDVQTQPGVGTGGIGMFKLTGGGNARLFYDQGAVVNGAISPSDQQAFNYQLANTQFDDGRAVQMVANNSQNGNSTGARYWDLFAEREVVGR